jgi:large subunit ribosomal protein L10
MAKALRRKMVDELVKKYAGAKNFVLVNTNGIRANEANDLRKELRSAQVRINAVKNSVAHHAFEKMGLKTLQKHLTGMTAVAYGADAAAIAKKLVEWNKKTKKGEIKAAVVEGQEFSAKQMEEMSKLASRPEQVSMILGALNGVIAKFIGTINEIPRSFVGVIKAIEEKQKGGK